MKRFILIITFVCIASVSILMFTECAVSPPSTEGPAPPPSYYIKFKLDGVQKNFDKGLTNYESNPFGNEQGPGTTLFATPDDETGAEEPDTYILIDFFGTDEDFYPAVYPIIDIIFELKIEGGPVVASVNPFVGIRVGVINYGAVGGTIEGMFSGVLDDDSIITEGEFKVLRAPDDTYPPD